MGLYADLDDFNRRRDDPQPPTPNQTPIPDDTPSVQRPSAPDREPRPVDVPAFEPPEVVSLKRGLGGSEGVEIQVPTSVDIEGLNEEVRLAHFDRYFADKGGNPSGIQQKIHNIGAQQPYVLRKPSSGGGSLSWLKASDSRTTPVGSIAEDAVRMTKFLASGKGVAFLIDQQSRQSKNPRPETRGYDPTIMIKAAAEGLPSNPQYVRHGGVPGFVAEYTSALLDAAQDTAVGEVTGELVKQSAALYSNLQNVGSGATMVSKISSGVKSGISKLSSGSKDSQRATLNFEGNFLGTAKYDPKGGPKSEGKTKQDRYHPGNPYYTETDGFADNYEALKDKNVTEAIPRIERDPDAIGIQRDGRTNNVDRGAPNYSAKGVNDERVHRIDKINVVPPITGESVNPSKEEFGGHKDLIPFRFFDVQNSTLLVFRAFLDGISDSPSSEWSQESYAGRPEKAHMYSGFDNTISFSFQVVAFSPEEFEAMWKKVNHLKGLLAPASYRWAQGGGYYMVPPFVRMTIGDLYKDVYGYFNSLSLSFDDDMPWEIDEERGRLPRSISVDVDWQMIHERAPMTMQKFFDAPFLEEVEPTRSSVPPEPFEPSTSTQDEPRSV
mgnify:CR=1 FL=1